MAIILLHHLFAISTHAFSLSLCQLNEESLLVPRKSSLRPFSHRGLTSHSLECVCVIPSQSASLTSSSRWPRFRELESLGAFPSAQRDIPVFECDAILNGIYSLSHSPHFLDNNSVLDFPCPLSYHAPQYIFYIYYPAI